MKKLMTAVMAAGALSAGSASAATYSYHLAADGSEATGIAASAANGMVMAANSPHPLPIRGSWNFVFNEDDTVDFAGVVAMNGLEAYSVNTKFTVPFYGNMESTVYYEGASHAVEGTGNWHAATRTLTYELPSIGPDSSLGSVYSETSSVCVENGITVMGQGLCEAWEESTPEWEGFSLELTFSEDLSSFSGVLKAIEQSGQGMLASTTVTTFELVGEVPVPAAAWLFGSGLAGLVGLARRRSRSL